MNEVDLKKKAEELEQTLQLQLAQLKKDSGVWLKVGGAAVVVGLMIYGIKKRKKQKRNKSLGLDKIAQESHWNNRRKKGKSKTSSFFPPLKKRLLLSLLSLGQAKLMGELNKRRNKWNEE